MPYGERARVVSIALYIAAFDRNDTIDEAGKNQTQYGLVSEHIDAPALKPLQPWLRWVERELHRRFDSLA